MSFPFFQGSIEDLLNVAGAGQGSFILGQLMRAQQQQQAADLDKSVLNNLSTRQEMDQKRQQFPLDLEKMRADIERIKTTAGLEGERIRELQRNTQIFDAAGGAQGEADRIRAERSERLAKALKAMRNEFEDTIQSIEYTNPKDMENKILNLATRYEMPEAIVQNILQASSAPENWNKLKKLIFDNSDKGREIRARGEEARTTATEVANIRAQTAIRTAEEKSKQAEIAAKGKNFEAAARFEMEAAYAAVEAGDMTKARMHQERANNYYRLAEELAKARARAGQEGKLDLPRTIEEGKPATRPPAAPTEPFPTSPPAPPTAPPPGAVKRIQ